MSVDLRSKDEVRAEKRKNRTGIYLVSPGLLVLALFFALPVVILLAMSLYVKPPGAEIGEFVPGFELGNYATVLSAYWPELLRSFWFALIATVLALLIGFPMAYLVAVRLRERTLLQGILLVLLIAPFFSSFILRTQAWKQILADEGFVAQSLKFIAILPADGHLTATPIAVVAGLTYNFLPFMVLPIYANLGRLDTRLLEASGDLYASPISSFAKVTLPMSAPGIFAGTLLTFIPAAGDYVNSALLGNNRDTTMIGQVIDSRFFKVIDYPGASALSFVLMISILILVTIYIRRFGTEELM
ncbi:MULTISPECIES: ABC transporter permease [Glutamicibacter]|uniref:ABC transporter permease n=1 Tax=Glutamicibacter halophytocola TaxID=1933880 RepID=A0A5B8IMX6_9MICC|nr:MULTISPECIES: ABC transporter permease [Glutamicibacter]ALG29866.1 ABC transporter permease [Glutamicibacter halophytocola]MBF6672935.1 ABC transporter permease [Glutamicibacter sp. FBE19]QDY66121.1 ABC transporter permease [Glutamicibacter halophytocola]UUX58223.1 ABC transporter permease [Glutamicibacter halophytocola]